MNNCYLCGKPGNWPKETLKYVLNSGLPLCEPHKTKLKEDLKDFKPEEKKETVLKTTVVRKAEPYMPPIPKEPVRDYNEPREPGEEG